MITNEETITPEQAALWLAGQHRNREINLALVKRFARDMRDGRWHATNQGIALDSSGRLVDGQHRLAAVVEFGSPVKMLVVRGIERDVALRSVDTGMSRKPGQLLAMEGWTNGTDRAAIARSLAIFTLGISVADRAAHDDIVSVLKKFQTEIDIVIPRNGMRVPAITRAMAALLLHHERAGQDFWEGVQHGVGLRIDDPRLQLREWLQNRRSSTPAELWVRTIATADAFLHGERLGKLMGSALQRYRRLTKRLGYVENGHLIVAISR